jgi:hypothetical protein
MRQKKNGLLLISLVMLLLTVFLSNSCSQKLTPDQAKAIAKEAYIYGFPMVVNYKTMYMYVVDKNSPEYKGGFNHLACMARVYTPADKAVVTPNSDTPYCMFWGDMHTEPLVLTIPEIEKERFYEVQLIDLFTHNFAYVSTVATGNKPGKYLITGPGWKGEKPEGITEVIPCETQFVFAIIRTQLFNPDDLENVKTIQDGYRFEPLSAFMGTEPPAPLPAIEFSEWKEGDQFTAGAFNYIDFMLNLVKTPPEEKELMKRFAKIGLGTADKFHINKFSPEVQEAIAEGVKEGFAELEVFIKKATADPLASAKIFGTREFLKKSAKENYDMNDLYMLRIAAAHTGLYGNSGAEAIYPTYFVDSEGQKLDASGNSYKIVFEADQLPPVSAFWSLTMYDGKTQLLIENPLNRYLLNSTMMKQFKLGEDGSLTLYIQKDSPGKELEANWLPAPDGPFYTVMRLYGPKTEALEGKWVNPPLVKE